MCVQRKVRVARNRKVVYRQGIEQLSGLDLGGDGAGGADLCKAVGDVEDEDDEGAVGRALDLKVAEE
jgi:hypothetical protein